VGRGREKGRRIPPLTVSCRVVNNVFVMFIPDFGAVRSWPATMVWRDSSGRVVNTIDERPFHP
jgi:hypothetical protein